MVNSSGFARYQEYKRKQDEEKKKKEEYRNNPSVKKNESLEYANLSPAQKQKVSYDKYKSAKANESQQKLQRIDQDRDKLTPNMNRTASVDKFEGMKKQADAEKKARAEQMPMLEKKIKDGHTLLPNEEYIYNKGSVEALSEAEQKAMRNIVNGYAQKVRSSEDYERQYAADLINQGANELKKLGWDQNKINDYSQRGERIAHTEWAESMKPTSENGFVNFMYNRATFIPAQIQGAVGDVVAVGKAVMGKNPEGQGRDMYNEWNRLNMQRDINSQYMQQKLGEQYGDAPNNLWGAMSGQNPAQMLFSAAESTGDSLIAMGVGQALAAGLGVAGAGAELEAVKANGGEVTSALSKAAQTERFIENIGTMPFMQQGYYSGYKEAREAGASEAGAELRGIASGLAEFVTEKVSLDSAWEIARGTKAGRGLLVNLLAQSGIEGSEEMASDLLNDIADGIISKALGDKLSDYDQKTADYMAQGESEESAKGKALLDKVDEYLVDGLMGALSGGLMGGSAVAQGYQASKTNQARDQFYSDSLAKYEGNNEYEVQANEDVDRYKQNPTRFYAESIDDSVEDNKRIKADLMSYADKVDSGLELSVSDRADIENLLGEAQRNNQFSKYKGYSEEIANVPTEYRTAVTNISVEEATAQMNEAAQNGDAEAMGNILHKMQNARSSEVKEAAEETFNRFVGLAENNGADAEAIENARISSQDAYLKGLKGEAIESSSNKSSRVELAYNEGTKAKLINESVTLEDSALKYENPEVAKQYIDNYTNDLSVPQYDQAFNTFATAGKARLNFDNLVNGRYGWLADKIGKDRARKFYDIGLNQADAEAKAKANAGIIRTLNHRKVGSFTDMRSDKSNGNYDQMLSYIANATGLNVRLWDDGGIGEGNRANYRGSKGEINLTVSNVSSVFHELTHFGQDFAPEDYTKFKSVVLETLNNSLGETEFTQMMRTYSATYGDKVTSDEITDELVASAMVGIMTDQKTWNEFGKVLAKNYTSEEAMSIKDKIIDFFKNILESFKALIQNSTMSKSERLVYETKIENQKAIVEQYSKMLDKAIQEHKNELMQNIVEVDEGDIRLSMATKDASMRALNEYLATSDLTEADKQDIRDHIEWAYGIAKKFTDNKKLVSFNQWQQTGLRTRDNGDGTKTPLLQVYNNGKPVRSVIVNNGEYPLNIDFSQVCKKRIALNDVLNKLVSDASLNIRILNEKDIAGINDIIKQHNFEIACGLCFVDAKRYRVGKWANTFVNGDKKKGSYGWNRLVKSLAPRNVGVDYFAVASDHIKPLGTLLTEVDDSQLDFTLVDKVIEPFLKEDGTIGQVIIDGKKANPTEDVKMAYLLRHHPELRKLLDKNDIIASEGLDALRENYLLVYNLLNAHGGTSKPKLSHGFTAYGGDIAKAKNFTPENAYKVGGVRVQSFSDYVANLFFDYMQMFADMTARQLPSHAYTKELDYVRLFGMTGQRINMSVIFKGADLTAEQQKRLRSLKTKAKILADPEFSELASHAGLDADGNYIYEDESIDFEKAKEIRHDSNYKYCGTIGVGLSDPHIRKMLNDPEFDMVIPYHSSGVSDIIKRARNLVLYTDYTSVQNTRGADGKKLDGGDGFAWYDYLKSDANPNGYDAKTVADMYLKHCDENGYLPKFDKFRDEPNYYKLLIDFRAYDNDGNFMPQGAVKMNFPENFESIVKESLIAQQEVDGRRQAELNDAQDSLYREVKDYLKKHKVIEEDDVRYSKDTDSDGKILSVDQQKFFEESKARDDNGNLLVMYHGSKSEEKFTVFKDLGAVNGRMLGDGFYFTPIKEDAKRWGKNSEGKTQLFKVYLNIKNPFVISQNIPATDEMIQYARNKGYTKVEITNTARFFSFCGEDYVREKGYDGIILKADENIDFYKMYGDQYVVFDANQIKKTVNKHPTENEDVRYSKTVDKKDMSPAQWASFYSAVGNYNDNYGVEDYELTPEGYVIIPITTVEKGKQKNIVVLSDGKLISPSVEKIVYLNAINDADNGNILKTVVLGEKDGDYQKAKHILEKVFGHGIISEVYGQDNRYYGEPNLERERRDSRSTIRFSKELQEQGRNGSGLSQRESSNSGRPLVDSEGNALTKAQQNYFENSKVRDKDGNLRVVYHGTSENFTVFDRTKTRANMDIQGMFFSPYDIDAEGYGNTKAYYLNITNPADESTAIKALMKFKGQNGAGIKARELLVSQGYDGVYNGYDEYIAFEPNQIKLIDNLNPTKNEDIRYSLEDGYGHHAGDLGKAEPLSTQGYDRGTGHFGTGTYFVGDENDIKKGGYGNRPHHMVDFLNYKLFRPKNENDGFKLHEFLKGVDGLYDVSDDAIETLDEWELVRDRLVDDIWDDSIPNEINYANAVRLFGKNIVDDTLGIENDGDLEKVEDFSDKIDWLIKDNYYPPRMIAAYINWNESLEDMVKILKVTPKEIKSMLKEIGEEISNVKPSEESVADSAATRFMKKLGYEGINVMGYPGLDNTAYGSVIYDLKGKDLEKKISNGARFSKEMKPLDLAARVYDFASDFDYYQTYDAVGEEGMNEIDAIAESISKGEVGYFIDTIEDILYDDDLDMLPETRTNGEQILNALKSFGGARYSLVERDDYITEDYEAPVEESILKEGLKALKNHPVNKSAVKKIAIDLINENHSTMSVSKLTNDISKAFAYLSTQEHMTYKDAARIMEEIAKPMLEASNDIEGDEEYNNFISAVGKVRLTDNQMKEVKSMFGSYGEFKAMVSPLQINMNAESTLDDRWSEIVDNSYGNLDYDTTENDQAFALYDAIRSLRPSIVNKFGGDLDEVSKEVGIRIIEEYLRNEGKEDTAKILKQGREEYRNKIKSQYDARLKRAREELAVDRRWQKNLAKRDYEERLKQDKEALKQKNAEYRQKLNEKFDEKAKRVRLEADVDRMWQKNLAHKDYLDRVAELRAKNKQLSQQKAETVRANKVKKSIEQNVVKLQKWIANPSEEHHVPMDMVEPILEFMTALDFVEPEIKTDGKTFYVNIFDHMEYHNGKKSPQYIRIEGKTKAEVRDKFYAQLDRGIGSARQRTWVDRMRSIKDLYAKAVSGNNFENSDVTDFIAQLDGSLVDELDNLIANDRGIIYVNDFDSKQLTVLDKVIKNIIQVVNRGNKAAAQNADIKLLSEDTISRSKGKVMSESKVRQLFLLDMATPLSFFDNMGDGASKIYRGLRNGFNTKIRDIRTASEFMKNLISSKKAKSWTGNNPDYKSFNIGGRKIDLTVAQIMSLYELVKRDQTLGHLKGGFTPTTFKTGKFNKITHNLDERPVHLTNEEIIRITDTLTDEQKRVADEMQHFLADTCSGWGNEVSRNLYGYEKFLDPNYFPITSDKNYLISNNENTAFDSLNGIERSGFTKQVIKNASNPIVIADIFDVFTKHVNDMATYHGFAAPIKDANRWFNYKTVESLDEDVSDYSSVKDAISRLSGQGGQKYYIKLIKDLNGMEKSQYIASFTDRLMSGYKSAAVGGNLRVVIQQPTAFFRAANIIDPKYLASALVSPREARRIGKMMREQSEIAWWKSQGYFETSIGKSMKNIITGQESTAERIKDFAMTPAGVADDITWGVLYTAVAKEQSTLGLKGDELEKAIKERFDEVVDQTQVVDSTLHRSQYMRSQDTLNKIQTAFMAEPIKSYNMLMRAAMTGEKSKMSRAAMTFIVTNVITAAAASLIDAFRRDDDDKDWGEEYVKAFKEGVIDNVNPLNLIPILKDVMNTIVNMGSYQTQSNRMDLDAVNSAVELIGTWKKYITGDSNKTWYGMLMATARPASQLTGIPAYNIMRDASALYNAFFPDLKKTISTNQYAEVYDLIKQGKDVDRIEEAVKKVVEKGGSISDIKSGISKKYKSDYYDMYQVDPNEAQKLGQKAARGYAAIGMDDEEIEVIIDSWKEESITYPKLYKAIMSGEGIDEQIDKLREAGKADDEIAEKVADKFFDTIVYADENEISSPVKENTDKAIKYITGMDFDSYIEAEEKAAIEAEAEKAAKAKATAEKKAKAEENKAIKQEKTGHKQNLYNNIDNGGDFKTNVEKIHQDGTDYDQIKSLLTKEYKGKNLTQQQKSRIATIKAYCDEKSGTKIAKKYNGNYYQYELDEINKW